MNLFTIHNGNMWTAGLGLVLRRYSQVPRYLPPHVDAKFSYAFGRGTTPLEYKTIGRCLRENAAKFPNKLAVISHHQNLEKNFFQFNQDVNKLAKSLLVNFNYKKGDVIGIWSANCYQYLVAQNALATAGLIHCSLSPLNKTGEVEHILKKGKVRALLMPSADSKQSVINDFHPVLKGVDLANTQLERVIYLDGPGKSNFDLNVASHGFNELLESSDGQMSEEITANISPDDTATLFFTSGTTGKPKGAETSHFTHVNNCMAKYRAKQGLELDTDQSINYFPIPLFHAFAGVLGSYGLSVCGQTVVLNGFRYTAPSLVEAVTKSKVTHIWIVPAMLIDVLNHCQTNQILLESVNFMSLGAAAVPPDAVRATKATFPNIVKAYVAYGCTETGPVITHPAVDAAQEDITEAVGIPIEYAEVKIIDQVTRQVVGHDQQGELLARGHMIMKGYWDEPEKTAEVIKDGWYSTGDMATMNSNGVVKIVGRTKELIIRGGANIYPAEVEELLYKHPAVLVAAVCGVPHHKLGEQVCAWIKLKDGHEAAAQDIKLFCKDKISTYKIPEHVMFVDEYPMTASGKVQKFVMTKKSIEILKIT